VEEVVGGILSRSDIEPIIIVQGDHGTRSSNIDLDKAGEPPFFERGGILNAIYLPADCRSSLYPTMTPVNTFRLVFNECLGTQFQMEEDTTFWRTADNARFVPAGSPDIP
jgi:hypothetical protein